jgi:hypothetical protein
MFITKMWLKPVIPALWETEIGRIKAPGQTRQKSLQDPISMEKVGMAACSCHPSKKYKIKDHGPGLPRQKARSPK